MAARNDLVIMVGILLCLLVIAVDADADADPIVINPSLLNSGTASSDDNIPTPGLNCKNNTLPSSNIATVTATKYTQEMCGATYIAQCDSDASRDPSYVDPCRNDKNNNVVTVTIKGQCDENVQQNCNSFVQLSPDAYNTIANPKLSPLLQINYGPATAAA